MLLRRLRIVLCLCVVLAAAGYPLANGNSTSWSKAVNDSSLAAQRYTLDAAQSKIIAHALRGGLFWFKGHDHLVALRDFTGEAQLSPEAITNSSLQITAKTDAIVA